MFMPAMWSGNFCREAAFWLAVLDQKNFMVWIID
jgi:hypothetical protein